ncbi:hypothetical protein GMMP13_190016 [Candidatus Magnetomoraceae bacterium gMMP-13]
MKKETRKFKIFNLLRFIIALGMIAIFTVGCGDSDIEDPFEPEGKYSCSGKLNTGHIKPCIMTVDESKNITLNDSTDGCIYTGKHDSNGLFSLSTIISTCNYSFESGVISKDGESYTVTANIFGGDGTTSAYNWTINGFAGTYEGTYTETTANPTSFTLKVDQNKIATLAVPTKTYTGVGISSNSYTVTVTEPLGATMTITISDERVVCDSDSVTETTLRGEKTNFEGTYVSDAKDLTLTVDSSNNITLTTQNNTYSGDLNLANGDFEVNVDLKTYTGTISKSGKVENANLTQNKIGGTLTGTKN